MILQLITMKQAKLQNKNQNDDENTHNEHYTCSEPNDSFIVLDKVLKILKPDVSYLEFKEIERLKNSNTEMDYGYYGDYTEDTIEWIVLEDLIKLLIKMVETKFSFTESSALKKRLHPETSSKVADPAPQKKLKVDQVPTPEQESKEV